MKTRRFYLFIVLILVFALTPAHAAPRMAKATPVGEIPFVVESDGRIYVTAFANGSDSLKFLVDTGASTIVLNPNSLRLFGRIHKGKAVENIGTTGENTVTESKDNNIKIGTIEYTKAKCVNIPYSPDLWDGVFGLNGLRAFNIEINYDEHKIFCYSKEEPVEIDDKHAVPLTFTYRHDVPFVEIPVTLGDSTYNVQLEVDTGSDRAIDLSTTFVSRNNLLGTKKPFATSRITSSDGGSGELKNIYFDKVTIGEYALPRFPGAFSTLTEGILCENDVDGMMGNNFLKRFNMLIDFKAGRIYLQPNNMIYTPFYGFLVGDNGER